MLQLFYSDFDRWPGDWRANARRYLGAGESARLARIGSRLRRDQFLAGRLLLRQCAAESYSCSPGQVQLAATAPVRAQRDGGDLCFVSISHCAHFVAVALAARPVGIDCERQLARRNWRDICAAYFAATEAEWLLQLPPERGQAEFLRSWTLKEALSKCARVDLGHTLAGAALVHGATQWSGEFADFSAWNGMPEKGVQVSLVCAGTGGQQIPDCRFRERPDNRAGEHSLEFGPLPRRS